jgi:hypothetical protein
VAFLKDSVNAKIVAIAKKTISEIKCSMVVAGYLDCEAEKIVRQSFCEALSGKSVDSASIDKRAKQQGFVFKTRQLVLTSLLGES